LRIGKRDDREREAIEIEIQRKEIEIEWETERERERAIHSLLGCASTVSYICLSKKSFSETQREKRTTRSAVLTEANHYILRKSKDRIGKRTRKNQPNTILLSAKTKT